MSDIERAPEHMSRMDLIREVDRLRTREADLGAEADALEVERDETRDQLRGAVGALRMIATWADSPGEPLVGSDAKAMRIEAREALRKFGGQ